MIMTQEDAASFLKIDISEVKKIIADENFNRQKVSLAQIQIRVCQRFNMTIFELVSHRRAREVAWPRMIAYWLSRRLTTASMPQIATQYAKDHSTIVYGCRRVEEWKHFYQTKEWYLAAVELYKELASTK